MTYNNFLYIKSHLERVLNFPISTLRSYQGYTVPWMVKQINTEKGIKWGLNAAAIFYCYFRYEGQTTLL